MRRKREVKNLFDQIELAFDRIDELREANHGELNLTRIGLYQLTEIQETMHHARVVLGWVLGMDDSQKALEAECAKLDLDPTEWCTLPLLVLKTHQFIDHLYETQPKSVPSPPSERR